MHTWMQSLNEGKNGERKSAFWAGRGAIFFEAIVLHLEWYLAQHSRQFRFKVVIGGEEDKFALSMGIPFLFTFWFVLGGRLLWKRLPYTAYETGFSISDGYLFLHLWSPIVHDSSEERRKKLIDLRNLVAGRSKHVHRTLSVHKGVAISFPEGSYLADIELFESTWTRKRWPGTRRLLRADIEMQQPIPIPGKGETGWDVDDDAVYSLTTRASTVQEAVQKMIDSVNKDRSR